MQQKLNEPYKFVGIADYISRKPAAFPDNPNVKFASIWKGWYEYLGVDISIFPASIDAWRFICKRENIKNNVDYFEKWSHVSNPSLPQEPAEMYKGFRGVDMELSAIQLFNRR
jgi:hypothetical protein